MTSTPGQAAYEAWHRRYTAHYGEDAYPMTWDRLASRERDWWADVEHESWAAIAAQEPSPELAMLRADLADAEALLARWPRCPAGCSCRVGIPEDADANECGCDGPCNGDDASGPTSQLREGDWNDAVSEATS